ncbi:MAG: MBL fold metallo-hydrolase [Thomasclavelia sp.]|uniref:MBL fold metallo-hydrolase n=1 Tax=Thomasclavelia sp. TaxID=3025757 RepID=UPI0039A0A53A
MKKVLKYYLIFTLLIFISGCTDSKNNIYQLSNQSYSQMMSYIIHYDDTTIVIDGGTKEDKSELIKQIKTVSLDGVVDAWLITHYHKDHTGALASYLLDNTNELKIKNIYYNFPDESWVEKYEKNRYVDLVEINRGLDLVNNKEKVEKENKINLESITVEIIRTFNSKIIKNAGNNSSTVYKVVVNNKSILFLGDLAVEAQEELLLNSKDKISNMDYVQMAHHGQAGVNEEAYKIINPDYCLWPTTDWLWENKDKLYKTDETKKWMKKIGVKKNYIANEGLISISLDD